MCRIHNVSKSLPEPGQFSLEREMPEGLKIIFEAKFLIRPEGRK